MGVLSWEWVQEGLCLYSSFPGTSNYWVSMFVAQTFMQRVRPEYHALTVIQPRCKVRIYALQKRQFVPAALGFNPHTPLLPYTRGVFCREMPLFAYVHRLAMPGVKDAPHIELLMSKTSLSSALGHQWYWHLAIKPQTRLQWQPFPGRGRLLIEIIWWQKP